MKDFSPELFSKWFDITRCKTRSLKSLVQDGTMLSRIKTEVPETVLIHLGQGDLWDKTEGNRIVENYKHIAWNILENTNTKVCFSLIIPLNGYPEMNSVIKQINTLVAEFVSVVRKDPKYNSRIFTSNNNSLSSHIISSVGNSDKGQNIKLNARGQKLLWIKLKDAFNRSLDLLPHRSRQSFNSQNNSSHTPHEMNLTMTDKNL